MDLNEQQIEKPPEKFIQQSVLRVKSIRDESLLGSVDKINEFLFINRNVEIIEIKELRTHRDWCWLIIYKYKEEVGK
jgi:hypothetical protein